MYTMMVLGSTLVILWYETRTGAAFLGYDFCVRRKESPGPYWFVLALQLLIGLCLAAATNSLESAPG